jgi:5'-3' exonuclease
MCYALGKLLKDFSVTPVFCYDGLEAKEPRRKLLPTYKSKRIPHDINPIPGVYGLLKSWPGIHIEQIDKEGDDAMAFAVELRKGKPCVVLSGDQDLWALMKHPNCSIYSPNLKRYVENADLLDKYHLDSHPEKVYLAKSLFGDTSDEIHGIKRLRKADVAEIINDPKIVTPEDFFYFVENEGKELFTKNAYEKLTNKEDQERVKINYQVVLPQVDFDRSSVKLVNRDSIPKLKEYLAKYECVSILEVIDSILG